MASSTGNPLPLHYGYVWVTGQKIGGETRQNTGNSAIDWTRVGGWLLGEGEMDGCEALWDTGVERLLFTSEFDNPNQFHFHRGCDAVIGSGLVPISTGTDQGVDSFIQYLPSGIQPLTYNRMAHYWLYYKLKVNNPENTDPENANNYTDLNPIGLWRGLRVRLFDSTGTMTGYGFSTNPTWQMVDLCLRRKLFTEYAIDPLNGVDDLTQAVRNRFDWGAIAAHAAICDTIMPNGGHRQFESNISITQQGTLQSVLSSMLQSCRSFFQERNGKISFVCDAPRSSVFTLSRKNTRSFTPDDKDLHTDPNRIVGKYRDIEIPACATIASISFADHQNPVVTTQASHPCAAGDYIIIGATNTTYDTQWVVKSVPAGDSVTQMTLTSRGTNYPSSVGAGGKIGLVYSRFKERSPEFNHHRNQYAKGSVGVGIPRQRNKVQQQIDFATSNYDQVSRVCRYERDRALGPDVIPYVTPVTATAVLDLGAVDAGLTGNIADGIDPGDHVTVDNTLTATMPGEYEVLDVTFQPDTFTNGSASAGSLTLNLGPYNETVMYSTSDPTAAGWETVPGSSPGNQTNYTEIPLADGSAYFLTGSCAGGQVVQLPAVGINPGNSVGWVSPQGHIDGSEHLHYIQLCDIDGNRKTSMIYSSDVGVTWTGDVNTAVLAWRTRSSATTSVIGSMLYIELTLNGGEKVIFGRGLVADGTTVQMPAGYNQFQAFMFAYMRDGVNTDHPAHGMRAYVDSNQVAHMDYQDGEGNIWHGNCVVLVFAWLNNMGSWTIQNGWARCMLAAPPIGPGLHRIGYQPKQMSFCVGGFSILDAGLQGAMPANFPSAYLSVLNGTLSTPGDMPLTTLQTMSGNNSFQITGHDAHGVANCYVDAALNSYASYEDGEGNIWYGSAGVLGLLCDYGNGSFRSGGLPRQQSPSQPGTGGGSGTTPTDATLSCSYNSNGDGTFTLVEVDVEAPGTGYTSMSTASATDGTVTVTITLTINSSGGIVSAVPAVANQVFNAAPVVSIVRAPASPPAPTGTFPSGLPLNMMGSNYPLNQPITSLPVDTRMIASTYGGNGQATATDTVDNHFRTYNSSYSGSNPHGFILDTSMPWSVVNSQTNPELLVTVAYSTSEPSFPEESDSFITTNGIKHTTPIPVKNALIEGESTPSADHHVLVYDSATGLLHELWRVVRDGSGNLTCDQYTQWNVATGARPGGSATATWTSADAAGLAIVPYILRYEDVQYAVDHNLPDLGHSLRFTVNVTRNDFHTAGWFIPPATHAAGSLSTIGAVMGQRLRMMASVPKPPGLSAFWTVVWNTLVKYGVVLADNGADWYLTADNDPRWQQVPTWDDGINLSNIFGGVLANQMEVVNNGPWTNSNGDTNGTLPPGNY